MKTARLMLITTAIGAVLGAWALTHKSEPTAPPSTAAATIPPTSVRVKQAWREQVSKDLQAVGSLRSSESVVLRPEIAGRIKSIHSAEGQKVKIGEELVLLDDAEQRASLTQSLSQETLEQQTHARTREVRSKNLLSQQQYDEVDARLKNARALVERDRVRLSKTRLLAPFDGVLGLRLVSPGDYVSPGQALVNLEAIDPIKLDFNIPEKYAAVVKPGLAIQVRVDAFTNRAFNGSLYAIDPRLDEATRTLRLRAKLPNPDMVLKPGMFARIFLTLQDTRDAVFVPEQSILAKGSQAIVFQVDGDIARATPVKTGERRPGNVEIVEGLQGHEWVVTDGQLKLRDGMKVHTVDSLQP